MRCVEEIDAEINPLYSVLTGLKETQPLARRRQTTYLTPEENESWNTTIREEWLPIVNQIRSLEMEKFSTELFNRWLRRKRS
jgi:hypothetical protein